MPLHNNLRSRSPSRGSKTLARSAKNSPKKSPKNIPKKHQTNSPKRHDVRNDSACFRYENRPRFGGALDTPQLSDILYDQERLKSEARQARIANKTASPNDKKVELRQARIAGRLKDELGQLIAATRLDYAEEAQYKREQEEDWKRKNPTPEDLRLKKLYDSAGDAQHH
jgi:hypothetical protein